MDCSTNLGVSASTSILSDLSSEPSSALILAHRRSSSVVFTGRPSRVLLGRQARMHIPLLDRRLGILH